MILQTMLENSTDTGALTQLAVASSIVIILGLALISFAIKKMIHLMKS